MSPDITNFYTLSLSGMVADLINKDNLSDWIKQNHEVCEFIRAKLNKELLHAYGKNDSYSRYEVQLSLFLLNNISISEPLSAAARNELHPLLVLIKDNIQTAWLDFEINRLSVGVTHSNISEQLLLLCSSHQASHHPIFDFFETSASIEQLDYFFKSDSALNILFFDLVASLLPGSLPETRTEICKNL